MIRALALACGLAILLPSAPGAQELQLNVIQESLSLAKSDILGAEAVLRDGRWTVTIRLSPAAAAKFGEITGRSVRKVMQIVAGGRILSAPIVMAPITGGTIVISGNFSEAEAKELTAKLK